MKRAKRISALAVGKRICVWALSVVVMLATSSPASAGSLGNHEAALSTVSAVSGNDIRRFRAVRISRTTIRVTVDYTYTGDRGRGNIFMGARLLTQDGRETGGYNPTRIWEGDNTVTLESYPDPNETTPIGAVRVMMYQSGGETIHSETFRYTVSNDIRNFRAVRISWTTIRVTVDYTYTGDRGRGNIFMGARLLTQDGRETGGYNPTRIWEGDNTVTLESYPDPNEPIPIGAIRVFMYPVINQVGVETIHSETFRYTASNDIRNFRAVRISRTTIRVTVDYTYTGDRGRGNIFMGARLLTQDGRETGGLLPARIWEGDRTVTLESYPNPNETTPIGAIRVLMYQSGGETIHSETFRYTPYRN